MPGVVTVGMDIERKWQPVRASGMPEVVRTGIQFYFTASATLDCGLKNEYQPLTAMVWQQKFQLLPTIADFLLIVPFFIPPPRASRLRCAHAVATAGDMVCAPLGVMVAEQDLTAGGGWQWPFFPKNHHFQGIFGKPVECFPKMTTLRHFFGKKVEIFQSSGSRRQFQKAVIWKKHINLWNFSR